MHLHRIKIVLFFFVALLLAGCAATNKSSKIVIEAQKAYSLGDFSKSLTICETTIDEQKAAGKEVGGTVYNIAGLSAWQLQVEDKALDYLEKSKIYSGDDQNTYFALATLYLKKDNLSKEINNLEDYRLKFPAGDSISKVNCQLLTAYVRSENWQQGDSLWNSLDSVSKENPDNITKLLKIKRELDMTADCDVIADKLLKIESKNIEALEYFADKYYNRADNTYVKEMKAYEKNQTMKQYKRLTEKLKEVNTDFKAARDYYEKLYKLNPQKRYAKNLGNIYTRFENKQKANYYYKLSK